jgi:YbbR domain-containing protein
MDRWFGNNNVVRVVAILLGVLLWVIVRLDVQNSSPNGMQSTLVSQRYTDVSISVVGLDTNRYSVQSIDPGKVNLQVSGSAAALRRVNISDYKVLLDLTGAQPGQQLIPLQAVGFPSGVEVDITPPSVTVRLEEKLRKEIPVAVTVVGAPAEGYEAGDPVVEPNRVNVTVSDSTAQEIATVVGEISVKGAKETVKDQVKLVALNAAGDPVDVAISPPVVDVEVPITSPFKTVPLQIKLNGTPPPGYAVGAFEQSAAEVTVYGSRGFLNTLEFYDGLSVDLGNLTETKSFEFEIPKKEGVDAVNPATVTATVTIVPAVTTTLQGIPLTVNGKSEMYDYRIISPTDQTFNVTVEAAPDIIANLTAKDVRAIVNVSNMPPGAHELPVEYNLPSFVKTAAGNINYVTVLIEAKDTVPNGSSPTSAGDKGTDTPTGGSNGAHGPGEQHTPTTPEGGAGSGGEDAPATDAKPNDTGATEATAPGEANGTGTPGGEAGSADHQPAGNGAAD